jgi:hypothetical protein
MSSAPSGLSASTPETTGSAAAERGWASRYWDCCKPSCSWLGNVPSFLQPARQCDAAGATLPSDVVRQSMSACDGGDAFACMDQAPAVDPTHPKIAYAFAATPGANPRGLCGTCFKATFPGVDHLTRADPGSAALAAAGKTLYVMATNVGRDVTTNQFDVMIPGGGVGLFDACSRQWNVSARARSAAAGAGGEPLLGAQYGGLLTQCQQEQWRERQQHHYPPPSQQSQHIDLKACVRRKCDILFGSGTSLPPVPSLLSGCKWFADWYEAADNPAIDFTPVDCPAYFGDHLSGAGFARARADYLVSIAPPQAPPSTPPPGRGAGGRLGPLVWLVGALLLLMPVVACARRTQRTRSRPAGGGGSPPRAPDHQSRQRSAGRRHRGSREEQEPLAVGREDRVSSPEVEAFTSVGTPPSPERSQAERPAL